MRSSRDYWSADNVIAGLAEVLEEVGEALCQGDGQNWLAILEALTQEYVSGWHELDDSDGELSDFFEDFGAGMGRGPPYGPLESWPTAGVG